MMLAYVYIIILTTGWVSELYFNETLNLKSYGDGTIGLKSHEAGWGGAGSKVRTPFW